MSPHGERDIERERESRGREGVRDNLLIRSNPNSSFITVDSLAKGSNVSWVKLVSRISP